MADLSLILLAGDFKRNAEKIAAWLKGDGSHHRKYADALVDEWVQRKYIAKQDVAELMREIHA